MTMPPWRLRTALALVSLAVVGLELAFMRALALRFWSHLAAMVIAVALLGFAAAGTLLSLLRRRVLRDARTWTSCLALAMAASAPAAWWACQRVPLDVAFLPWAPWQGLYVLVLQAAMLGPFLLGGAALAIAMLDDPARLGGHYAANLAGSGAGALASVAALYVLGVEHLATALAATAATGGAMLMPWRRRPVLGGASALAAAAVLAVAWARPVEPGISPYSMLAQARSWPDVRLVAHRDGPLGRIDVLAGPTLHHAPGLSLQYDQPLPPQAMMIADADQTCSVYDCRSAREYAFLDHTTWAAPYHVLAARAASAPGPAVCVIGAGGGEGIGLALFHHSTSVTALEVNPQVIDLMRGELADRGGWLYRAPGVQVLNREARHYFSSPGPAFDLIHLPPLDAFGASGAGRLASQESFLYTVQSLEAMLGRLAPGGMLGVTRWARTPPRDELRMLDMGAQALRRRGRDPRTHLALLRSWATVTLLVCDKPLAPAQTDALRRFCDDRGFDLCWLDGLRASEVNRRHVLEQPIYFQAARALLGPGRRQFLDDYLFAVEACDDDRPYFFHSFRWRALTSLIGQLGGMAPAFIETGYLLHVAALAQALLLGLLLVLLPLAPRAAQLRGQGGKAASLACFLLMGAGFMLLEVGFFQRLILAVGNPVYSAAAVIAGFLVFAGMGSAASSRWAASPQRIMRVGGLCVVAIALLYLLALDDLLALVQPLTLPWRVLLVEAIIAPLALAMGHLFPSAMRQLGRAASPLVPWAWAVNGVASVAAALAAPLLAMAVGFRSLVLVAAACYALAALAARALPVNS